MRCPIACWPSPGAARSLIRVGAVAVLALALGACSSSRQAAYQGTSWAGAQPAVPAPAQHQAAYVPEPGDPIKDAPIEPRRAPNGVPDDASEPFSPNYGGPRNQPPSGRVAETAAQASVPLPGAMPAQAGQRLPDGSRAYFRRVTTAAAD